MNRSVSLFEHGTPDAPGEALAAYRRVAGALGEGTTLAWHVDPGNLGLLSRAMREVSALAPSTLRMRTSSPERSRARPRSPSRKWTFDDTFTTRTRRKRACAIIAGSSLLRSGSP